MRGSCVLRDARGVTGLWRRPGLDWRPTTLCLFVLLLNAGVQELCIHTLWGGGGGGGSCVLCEARRPVCGDSLEGRLLVQKVREYIKFIQEIETGIP